MTWPPGADVVVQEIWRDRVWAAKPMKVVRDDGDFVALWLPKGTRWKAPTLHPTLPWAEDRGTRLAECAGSGRWIHRDGEWDGSTLVLMREGDWHALWISWLDSGEQWGWYVNLQLPFRRTERGFATMDLMLDVVIDLDGTWRWKDEDELAVFVECGVFEPALAARVREEGLEVVRRFERDEPPFDEPWPEWRPHASWTLPELPSGWDVPCR